MDYGVASELIAAGRMPNFGRLAAEGSFGPLETSIPPQSPVAWSNFTTGMDSGGHGIYDFLRRDPETMALAESTTLVESGGLKLSIGRYQFPLSGDSVELLRRGRAFWEVLEDHGIETTVIRMPANFPPSETASRELSGMGTPDLPGTLGTFSFYTSRLFAFRGQDISGGAVYEVDVVDNTVEANLYGPENPFLIEPELAVSPFTVYLDPVDPVAKLVVGSEERVLRAGEWTDWIPADFDLIPTQVVTGMARFYLRSVRPDFELYVTPVNIDPLNPAAPVSYPDDFAAELADATGRFYTQGMPEDTKALQAGVLSIDEFLAQAKITGDEIVAQYKYVLERYENGFLFYYFGNLDQVSHMLWHTRDPEHPIYDAERDAQYANVIEDLYVEFDGLVGYTLDNIGDDTTLIVLSDHGFGSFRRSFHMNAWLKEHGYLTVRDENMREDPGFFVNIDLPLTRAYNAGLNALYLNVEGRESSGIVLPEQRTALIDEIAEKLLAEVDPATGQPAVTKVYKRDEVFEDRGEIEIGPDMIIGYAAGTRGSGHSAVGAVADEVLTDNVDEWPGDHEWDHETVPGVLLSNKPLKRSAPRLQDLAAAILAEFGIEESVQDEQ